MHKVLATCISLSGLAYVNSTQSTHENSHHSYMSFAVNFDGPFMIRIHIPHQTYDPFRMNSDLGKLFREFYTLLSVITVFPQVNKGISMFGPNAPKWCYHAQSFQTNLTTVSDFTIKN